MTQQQTQQQIQFTIQTLQGETFQVSLPVTEAEKVYQEPSFRYKYYGLDYLKEAICSSTGNDPVSQQLIGEEELTIQTSLLPLVDTVITLIVKPSFTIKFIATQLGVRRFLQLGVRRFLVAPGREQWIICYFHPKISNLRAIGQRGDYFKIAIADLKSTNAYLGCCQQLSEPYLITTDTPTYGWIRFDKDNMKIVSNS
jgi:hypothetical protein